jgi:hypothetical protein
VDVSRLQDGYIMSWYMSYASALINRYNTYTGECLFCLFVLLRLFDHPDQHQSRHLLHSSSLQPHLFRENSLLTVGLAIAGIQYKDDPTIFSWELANEPRCQGSGTYSSSNQ